MLLVLMRHGIAEDGPEDEKRKLTPKGRERVALVARSLDLYGVRPGIVLSSHRVRALETAEIVCSNLGLKVSRITRTPALDLHESWRNFADAVNGAAQGVEPDTTVLACGHQPQLGMLATMALTGHESPIGLKKGSVLGIQFNGPVDAGHGELRFYLTAAMARALH